MVMSPSHESSLASQRDRRAAVPYADSYGVCRKQAEERVLALPVRLWGHCRSRGALREGWEAAVLRLPSAPDQRSVESYARRRSSRPDEVISRLGGNASPLRKPGREGVPRLWGPGCSGLRGMASQLSRLQDVGAGERLCRPSDNRTREQRRQLRAWKLSLGHGQGAGQQPPCSKTSGSSLGRRQQSAPVAALFHEGLKPGNLG